MAIGWLTILKSVPWTEVIGNAPKVADGAKKLWNSVGKKTPAPPSSAAEGTSAAASAPEAGALALVHARLTALEAASSELQQQMLASTEVIKSLAEQNAQLIRGIEENRRNLRRLAGAAIALGVITAASWVWLLSR